MFNVYRARDEHMCDFDTDSWLNGNFPESTSNKHQLTQIHSFFFGDYSQIYY